MSISLNLVHPDIHCNNCEDSGYRFDTCDPCRECALGKPIQYLREITELRQLEKRAKGLRKTIKQYEKENKS